jgi:hypothetical protein
VAKDKNKQPGRLAQLWRVYKLTAKSDPSAIWLSLLAFLLATGAGLLLAFFVADGNVFSTVLWIVTGVFSGILIAMIVMSRRAEKAAYTQIEGQAGAVGAVLDSQIRRGWRANSMPVAVSPKTREAVYRMIGAAGVVLIAEGDSAKLNQMLEDEARKIQRAVPGVTIQKVRVNLSENGTRLHALLKTVYKLPKAINRSEITAVANRLDSLAGASGMPIPKGIDPMRARAPKRKS